MFYKDHCLFSVSSVQKLVVLCMKDVEVIFELMDRSWSVKAEFLPSDIHHQVISIVF